MNVLVTGEQVLRPELAGVLTAVTMSQVPSLSPSETPFQAGIRIAFIQYSPIPYYRGSTDAIRNISTPEGWNQVTIDRYVSRSKRQSLSFESRVLRVVLPLASKDVQYGPRVLVEKLRPVALIS